MTSYDNIFSAHFRTLSTVILWGSSGFGKSSLVRDFAKRNGFNVLEKRSCYVDPLGVVLPHKNLDKGVVEFLPADWLKALIDADTPTILFLDEFNRPASLQTLNLFTELLLDRSIDGMKISDKVLIVAGANLSEEDTGVTQEIPVAVMNRATHIVHAPSHADVCKHMVTETARAVVAQVPTLVRKPGIPELHVENCPRQIDAACQMWELKDKDGKRLLSHDEFRIIAQGRVGREAGLALTDALVRLEKEAEFALPKVFNRKAFSKLAECEGKGMTIEVVGFLNAQAADKPELVAEYLVMFASPETCRSLAGFDCVMQKLPEGFQTTSDAFTTEAKPGLGWQFYAARRGKLVTKRAA